MILLILNHYFLFILLLMFVYIIYIFQIPLYKIIYIKNISIYFSFLILILTLILFFIYFDSDFLFTFYINWGYILNIRYSLGLDSISILFIILTAFLIPCCILTSYYNIIYNLKDFIILLFIIELLIFNIFSVLDYFFFYIFFESVLIPMFILIGFWGSRQRKIHASYQFFFYTLLGSIIMLLGILNIYSSLGTTDYRLIALFNFPYYRELFLWFVIFVALGVKIPIIPFHIWLPEAHVEAPTTGSIILAGILLKLGTYGIVRFLIYVFPFSTGFFLPLVLTIIIIAIIYTSLTTIRQIDLKKIIAYSSVAHMNFALFGLFSNNLYGICGGIFLMLGHGFVSSSLFILIGIIYDRYSTRNLLYYSGLVQIMPLYSIIFLIFTLANISFPGTVNFVGELLVFLGIFHLNIFFSLLSSFSVILGAIYSIWLFNRIIFGRIKNNFLLKFVDISRREFFLLFPFVLISILMGLKPSIILNFVYLDLNVLLCYVFF